MPSCSSFLIHSLPNCCSHKELEETRKFRFVRFRFNTMTPPSKPPRMDTNPTYDSILFANSREEAKHKIALYGAAVVPLRSALRSYATNSVTGWNGMDDREPNDNGLKGFEKEKKVNASKKKEPKDMGIYSHGSYLSPQAQVMLDWVEAQANFDSFKESPSAFKPVESDAR